MLLGLIFLTLNLLASIQCAEHRRRRRYLVYPDGGPARTQFIIGLGIPVDLKEQSVTVGTVIKFQYDLPTNSTEYTSRIYGFADTVSRDMDGNTNKVDDNDNNNDKSDESDARENKDASLDGNKDSTEDDESTEDNALVDLTFDNRKKRSLIYTEGGTGNEITSEIPLQEAIKRQEMIDERIKEQDIEPQRANRWDFYKIIEHMAERYGYSGRPCMLKTICEAAEIPFTHDNGLLGEIGHILFTPSTTKDQLSHHSDNEYHAAERLGRDPGVECEQLFPECGGSVLETFTQIGVDTLHQFGL